MPLKIPLLAILFALWPALAKAEAYDQWQVATADEPKLETCALPQCISYKLLSKLESGFNVPIFGPATTEPGEFLQVLKPNDAVNLTADRLRICNKQGNCVAPGDVGELFPLLKHVGDLQVARDDRLGFVYVTDIERAEFNNVKCSRNYRTHDPLCAKFNGFDNEQKESCFLMAQLAFIYSPTIPRAIDFATVETREIIEERSWDADHAQMVIAIWIFERCGIQEATRKFGRSVTVKSYLEARGFDLRQ